MKYNAPAIVNQHNAFDSILGVKGTNGPDSNIMDPRSSSAAYESDE